MSNRVSIPNNVRKTIQNIKEITGNHTEDEIYAMLKECSMDPNEATQKLLSQDPFHEVKRKRDRKKEITSKEFTEPRWKPGMQGRGNRAGRGNYSPRHTPNDAGGSRNVPAAKEKEINKGADDGVIPPAPQEKKNKEASVVASSTIAAEKISTVPVVHDTNKSEVKIPTADLGDLSASDPILMASQDSRLPIGTIRRAVVSQRTPVDQVKETPVEVKVKTASAPETGGSFMQRRMHSEFQGDENILVSESSRPISRPSSNYNNRSQQAIGPPKVGPVKEWKPKPTNPIPASEVPVIPVEDHSSLKPASSIPDSEESHMSDGHHVIIPTHLHVPEVEKLGFHFGSFDATFGIYPIPKTASLSEASEEIVEHIEEQPTRDEAVMVTADDRDYTDGPSSSSTVPENLSPESDVSSNVAPEHTELNQETSLPTSGHQYPVAHPPNLSFGFMPPIIGSHMGSFETNESQARDASRVPSFVVQQPFDPVGYYPQFYRSSADNDGRISPFHTPKYNGNVPALSQQASQSSQEVENSLMLSTGGPTTLVTQAGGVTQQPMPVFRQPTGLHFPHYPPNYIPYGPYFSPFYLPPPAIHQFLSNGAFPQQPQGSSMYPAPPIANPKYPLPQYRPGGNTGNSGHIGVPGAYGPYGSNPTGYSPNPAASAGNSTSNDDFGGSQFKENNVYVTGQQSEGSGVWIAAPGRDMSGSYYNLPQGGQVTYSPAQSPHGTFASIYQPVTTGPIHPLLQQPQSMAGAVDMVGPTSTMYKQQPNQINWPSNY